MRCSNLVDDEPFGHPIASNGYGLDVGKPYRETMVSVFLCFPHS
jgi:hypothetical protein